MRWHKIYGLSLRHIYLIRSSFPRILDLIYWPSVQVFLWGFISQFFTLNSNYYNNTVGVILTAAILYDFLFIAPIKISEIIAALTMTSIVKTLIGLIPAVLLAIPIFGVSIFKLGVPLIFLLIGLYLFGISLGLFVTSGLLRFGPSFENIAWASLFFLAPLGCIYYPIEILPGWLQVIAKGLPLVHIFEEMRNILINQTVNTVEIVLSLAISGVYFILGVITFYTAYYGAKIKGTLINIGE